MDEDTDRAGERSEGGDGELTPARLRDIAGRAEALANDLETVFGQLDDVAELLGPVSSAKARALVAQGGRDADDMANNIANIADRLAHGRARTSGSA